MSRFTRLRAVRLRAGRRFFAVATVSVLVATTVLSSITLAPRPVQNAVGDNVPGPKNTPTP